MYQTVKHLHITCVILSGAGFALRGWWAMIDSPLLQARFTRVLPHLLDSVLLASAVTLAVMAQQYPFVHAWLTAKVLGLLLYIGLGAFALRKALPCRVRLAALLAAMGVFAYIVSVAVSKSPWGWLAA